MTHTIPCTASLGVELTVNLTGVYQPGARAPAMRGEPPTEPDDDESIEDIAIEAILVESRESFAAMFAAKRAKRAFITHDILTGVDTSNEHIQRLLSNLLSCIEESAAQELLEAVVE